MGDQFLDLGDLNVWSRGDIVREIRCSSLLGVRGLMSVFLAIFNCLILAEDNGFWEWEGKGFELFSEWEGCQKPKQKKLQQPFGI